MRASLKYGHSLAPRQPHASSHQALVVRPRTGRTHAFLVLPQTCLVFEMAAAGVGGQKKKKKNPLAAQLRAARLSYKPTSVLCVCVFVRVCVLLRERRHHCIVCPTPPENPPPSLRCRPARLSGHTRRTRTVNPHMPLCLYTPPPRPAPPPPPPRHHRKVALSQE